MIIRHSRLDRESFIIFAAVKIGNIELGERPVLLAPMEDVTDPSFRYICKAFGADLMYTEFISSDGLIRDAAKTIAPPLKRPATHRLTEAVELPSAFTKASWVWYPGENQDDASVVYLRKSFEIKDLSKLKSAFLAVAVDDYFTCAINGHEVMRQELWQCAWTLDVLKYLHEGENELVVKGMNAGGPCGALFALTLSDGTLILSGEGTQASKNGQNGWVKAENLGAFGGEPWSNNVYAVPYVPDKCDRDFDK